MIEQKRRQLWAHGSAPFVCARRTRETWKTYGFPPTPRVEKVLTFVVQDRKRPSARDFFPTVKLVAAGRRQGTGDGRRLHGKTARTKLDTGGEIHGGNETAHRPG